MNATTVLATRYGRRLQTPDPAADPALGQSLSQGAAGIALWHVENARCGAGSWEPVKAWLAAGARADVTATDSACLSYGAPALAFVLHAAGADGTARDRLDAATAALAHRRVAAGRARIRSGALPAFAEYDLLHGLTGIGLHLLHHAPGDDALAAVLSYLVALTRPVTVHGEQTPGWWCVHDPARHYTPGGHANFGMAHGITGPLALLAQAARRGILVEGQMEAVSTLTDWFDRWRQEGEGGPWWPETITRAEMATGRPSGSGSGRPSWCYGIPGISRALQLAALATADTGRQEAAENALAACLADAGQLGRITSTGLCHGMAGLFQTVWRTAQDARTPDLSVAADRLGTVLMGQRAESDPGLLEGAAGQALALATAARGRPPASGWDAYLLIS
ncbi:lanthionine synthetase C family protein [Streptomyces sp. NBC_01244]|uniref:lanthionine synthetase C family protein n=1 Tax=Streptomyces sp. NBC_01244 TaxID=2903797 RepID=UPI002E0E5950|nr:lanthionine synthetase C family protein [Streptomyces sp. NBC_01244]